MVRLKVLVAILATTTFAAVISEGFHVWKLTPGDKEIVPKGAFTIDGSWPSNHYTDYPASVPSLFRLAMEENKFYMILKMKSFPGLSSEGQALVYRYTRRYEIEVIDAISRWALASKQRLNFLAILDHPFLIFQMLRRMVYEFPKLYSVLNATLRSLPDFDPVVSRWPEENDVYFFGSLVVVLHHFYDFDVFKFGRGTFGKIVTGVNLSAIHAMELSRFAEKQQCLSSAVEFSSFAYDQAHRVGGISLNDALEAYKRAVTKHDSELGSFTQTSNYGFFLTPIVSVHNFTFNRKIFVKRKTLMQFRSKRRFPSRLGSKSEMEEMDSHTFMSLCKGENWQATEVKARLTCHYKIISGICPYKLEVLSLSPRIVIIYELVESKEIDALTSYAFPRLTVVTAPEKEQRKRTGTFCTVRKDFPEPALLNNLELKAELLTELNIRGPESSQEFYVTLNGPGGTFRPQRDSVGKHSLHTGHYRLGTLQIHLNKVEAGGRTAFHRLGLASRPEARSALFWFNHHKNGTVIDNMFHGGCPVVLGHKWVATKWILGPGNFNKYRCALNRNE